MYIYCTYIKTGVWHIVCPDDLLSGSARTEDACGKKTIKKEKKKKNLIKTKSLLLLYIRVYRLYGYRSYDVSGLYDVSEPS